METSNLTKYQSVNPVQRWLIDRFEKRLVEMVTKKRSIKKVIDVGCGEGFGMRNLKENNVGNQYLGIDASSKALKLGKKINPGFSYHKGDIYRLPVNEDQADLVMCCEVLEHLERPEEALSELKRISKKYVLLSVPYEPWFRLMNFARGKYLKTLGNHPEHINWWGTRSFNKMVSKTLKVRRQITVLPWQIILAESA
mgnify:CR=1 FL=1